MHEKKVNLFLVGAAKSGTTSVAEMLKQHKDVFVPYYKEPFFFIDDYGINSEKEYNQLYSSAAGYKFLVDASTGYLSDEKAPNRLFSYNPSCKILIILRNPIDFCFSYWKYMRANGLEKNDFSTAISDEIQSYRKSEEFRRSSEQWPDNYLYKERAKYYTQVKRYIDIFGRDSVKVILFEELISNQEIINEIFEFLSLDNDGIVKLPKENASGEVRGFYHFLRFSPFLRGIKSVIKKYISQERQMSIRKKMIKKISECW